MRFLLMFAAAMAVPVAVFQSPAYLEKLRAEWQKNRQDPPATTVDPGSAGATEGDAANRTFPELSPSLTTTEPALGQVPLIGQRVTPESVPLEGYVPAHLGEIFRFDVHPNWVYRQWQRKKTIPTSADVYGVRVPLVTGTSVDSLAGALTYYFNNSGQVEWITFRGRTGDTSPLAQLMTQQFGMQPQAPGMAAAAAEQWYETKWNGRPVSRLRVTPQPVIWATDPRNSFDVDLHLERPGSSRYLDDRPLLTAEQQQAMQEQAEAETQRTQAEIEQAQQQAKQAQANADQARAKHEQARKQLEEARAAADKNLREARDAVRRAEAEARQASAARQTHQDRMQDAWQQRQQPLDWLRGQVAPRRGATPAPSGKTSAGTLPSRSLVPLGSALGF